MREVRIVDGEVITLPAPAVDREKLMRALEDVARDEAERQPPPPRVA